MFSLGFWHKKTVKSCLEKTALKHNYRLWVVFVWAKLRYFLLLKTFPMLSFFRDYFYCYKKGFTWAQQLSGSTSSCLAISDICTHCPAWNCCSGSGAEDTEYCRQKATKGGNYAKVTDTAAVTQSHKPMLNIKHFNNWLKCFWREMGRSKCLVMHDSLKFSRIVFLFFFCKLHKNSSNRSLSCKHLISVIFQSKVNIKNWIHFSKISISKPTVIQIKSLVANFFYSEIVGHNPVPAGTNWKLYKSLVTGIYCVQRF